MTMLGQLEALRDVARGAAQAAGLLPYPATRALLADDERPSHSSGAVGACRPWQPNREPTTAHEEENPMCRVMLLKDRNKFRVRVIDRETGRMTSTIHATEEEARAKIRKVKREYNRPIGIPFSKALEEWEMFQRAKGNRIRSIQVTAERLGRFFEGVSHTDDLTPAIAAKLWAKFTTTPTRMGKPPAFDTQANTLQQARTFIRWIIERGWTKVADPMAGVKAIGKRSKGKRQLVGVDESRRFLATALKLGQGGDEGAVASAMALLMGMRASEIVDRTVRELDDGGRILLITHAKTRAGVRRLMVPEVLKPLLLKIAEGKASDARLFPYTRHWLLRSVGRVCRLAGVPVVPAHGLRGTHATLAVEAGLTGPTVAAALGHTSFEGVTAKHYATTDSVDSARVGRVLNALN